MRNEKTEVEYRRNDCSVRHSYSRLQINSDQQRVASGRCSRGRSKRTVPLHPGLVVVARRRRGITACVMMAGVMQQRRRKAFRTNLQRKLAIAARHEANRYERAKRQRNHQEAGEPPVPAEIGEANGHFYRRRLDQICAPATLRRKPSIG